MEEQYYDWNRQAEKQYQQKLDRLDRQWNELKTWMCLCFLGLIIAFINNIYTFVFLIVVMIYVYMFMKQLLEYNVHRVISDWQVAILLIVGLIAFVSLINLM